VVTFDARGPGTSVATWEADPRLATLPAAPGLLGSLLVLAAHADDETLGAGSLIASAARAGQRVTVVVVTDGTASHPESETTTSAELGEARRREARAALDELGPGVRLVMLGVPDGGIREHRAAVRDRLVELVDELAPSAVVSTWRGDGHRDHRVLGEVAAEVVAAADPAPELLEYPVWMWHWGSPDHPDVPWPRLVQLTVGEEARVARQRALARYVSQVMPLSARPGDEAVLRPEFLAHFAGGRDVFVRTASVPASEPESASSSAPAPASAAEHEPAGDSAEASRFDGTHAARDDPWGVTTRWYERRKRALVLGALPDERYGTVLEVGCSIGVVTSELAPRADHVLALDVSPVAVQRARERLADQPHVRVDCADASEGLPEGRWDLVVLGEVGYYLEPAALTTLLDGVAAALTPTGTLVACHWRHGAHDFAQGGDEVHAVLADWAERAGLHRVVQHVEADFLLDVFSLDGRSVAERTGLR
jgi:LmbE family N-acetylglucosaminyl deacetylase/SAM-dependent methyltransferase